MMVKDITESERMGSPMFLIRFFFWVFTEKTFYDRLLLSVMILISGVPPFFPIYYFYRGDKKEKTC